MPAATDAEAAGTASATATSAMVAGHRRDSHNAPHAAAPPATSATSQPEAASRSPCTTTPAAISAQTTPPTRIARSRRVLAGPGRTSAVTDAQRSDGGAADGSNQSRRRVVTWVATARTRGGRRAWGVRKTLGP
ncbi:hypothetical protein ACIBI0_27855 [Microbispora rosea]|uniref:hypothetical protein n=1 Tax=Microbispora rosea TaxID=58117 RepID=UPI0037B47278